MDWKSSLTAYCTRFGAQRGLTADWQALVVEWRSLYKPAIAAVRDGARLWATFDELHRETLDTLLPKYGLNALSDADRDLLVHGWHRLAPWPDALEGLMRLKQRYLIGALSNGTTRQLATMAKSSGLPWDVIFGADIFHTYKPAPALYRGAIELVGAPAETIVMVAAHHTDLQAARAEGMRTAFIRRLTEDGEPEPGPQPARPYDFMAGDFLDLAAQLGTGERELL